MHSSYDVAMCPSVHCASNIGLTHLHIHLYHDMKKVPKYLSLTLLIPAAEFSTKQHGAWFINQMKRKSTDLFCLVYNNTHSNRDNLLLSKVCHECK